MTAAILTTIGLLASPTAALADERRPPRGVLRDDGSAAQTGTIWSYCWSYSPGGDTGWTGCADGWYSWPNAARVDAGERLALRWRTTDRPRRIALATYEDVRGDDRPKGTREHLDYRLKAVRSRGEVVAWEALFELDEAGRHYYIDAYVVWNQGDVSYTFHART